MPGLFLSAATIATESVTSADFASVITALQSQISIATVVEILGVCAGVAAGFAFMWWGVRKVVKALMGAFKKGKISL